jgi:DNA-binding CsgD family transcriptional regulator
MRQDVYDQLVAAFYDAAVGRASWPAALEPLAQALDLWGVQLLGIDRPNRSLLFSHEAGPMPPAATLDYLRRYHAINPHIAPAVTLPVGHWMHSHQLFDDAAVASNPFYQEFMIPHGARHLSGTKLYEDANALVLFSALRGVSQPPLNEGEMLVLDRLKLHLVRAMQNYVYLGSTFGEPGAARRLLDHFHHPMFLVDEQRHVRFRNSLAQDLLRAGDYLQEKAGSLTCRDPECDALLLNVVRGLELSAKPGLQRLPSRKFARIRRANGAPVGLFAIAIRPETTLGAFGQQPLALLVFHNPREQAELDGFIVAEMFDLSPAEAKVAVALARGKSPDKIAAAGRIAISTVRAQIKSIFAKTGVSRQSELVALLRGMPEVPKDNP